MKGCVQWNPMSTASLKIINNMSCDVLYVIRCWGSLKKYVGGNGRPLQADDTI